MRLQWNRIGALDALVAKELDKLRREICVQWLLDLIVVLWKMMGVLVELDGGWRFTGRCDSDFVHKFMATLQDYEATKEVPVGVELDGVKHVGKDRFDARRSASREILRARSRERGSCV